MTMSTTALTVISPKVPLFLLAKPYAKDTIPAAKRKAAIILTTVVVASVAHTITKPIAIAASERKMLLNLLLYPNVIICRSF